MNIRVASGSDYSELMNLYNAFVGEDRYSRHKNDSFSKVLASDSNFVYIIEDNQKLIGFVSFSIRNVIRYPQPILEVDELFVGISFRGHGLGRQLVQLVLDKAKELNCYRVYIESHYDHKPAHKLYEKMGFTNYGYHFIKNVK